MFSRAHNFSFFPRENGLSYQSSSISLLSVNAIHSLPFYPEGTVSAGPLNRKSLQEWHHWGFLLHNLLNPRRKLFFFFFFTKRLFISEHLITAVKTRLYTKASYVWSIVVLVWWTTCSVVLLCKIKVQPNICIFLQAFRKNFYKHWLT